jgi:hypothetical protein
MNKTLVSFGQGWWEKLPAKLTPQERDTLQREDDPDARSRTLRDLENRSRRPATPEDGQAAEMALRKHHEGDYLNACVILPKGHGSVTPREGSLTRF